MSFRVLVADDSILFRRIIALALESIPDVEVVGSVPTGKLAVQRILTLQPDLLTLDLEMPEMGGLAVLDALKQSGSKVSVIVVSSLTRQGAQITMRALEKGAFDFITKPATENAEQSRAALIRELTPMVRALSHRLDVRKILRATPAPAASGTHPVAKSPAPVMSKASGLGDISSRMNRISAQSKPELVLIGVSTGGPNALAKLLPAIPGDIGVPLLLVQHMPPLFTQTLAEGLAARCAIRVQEAADGLLIQPNTAYIAPGGRQMRLVAGTGGGKSIQITDDPPENNCRPAVDYLFRSVANNFPGQAMAVILTGMGSDGTIGLRLLKRHGCYIIAQDEASCVVYGMPKAAVDAGVADVVLPIDAIAARIGSIVRGFKS